MNIYHATEDRGFASMDPMRQKEIAARGGKAAHEKGTAHEFSADEAREAGRKGGQKVIHLVLSSLPIDEVPGQVAMGTFFQDVRPLKGSVSLIDWRLNGRLSDLILQGRISGEFAESLIMPSQGRLAAREIILFGLGQSREITEKKFEEGVSLLIEKLVKLKSMSQLVEITTKVAVI